MEDPNRPRFIADAMLGRLARWLRMLGYDTAYEAHIDDAALVHRAIREERILLTRDHRLIAERRPGPHLFVRDDAPLAQLGQVIRDLDLPAPDVSGSRCTQCNDALVETPLSAVAGRVPSYVAGHHADFRACPGCGRVYWKGTHVARMAETIRRLTG